MNRIIKIAIPTDDGVNIEPTCCTSRAFLIATIASGRIIHQELRWNLLSEIITSGFGYFYNLIDCNILIVREIKKPHELRMKSKDIVLVRTDETEIKEAFLHYLKCLPVLFE